jgi:hypothetical protein
VAGVALWLLVLVAMAAAAVIVLRRMSVMAAKTRDLERFQRATAQLDLVFGSTAEPLVRSLDELRRHAGDPQAVAETLPAASAALRSAVTETRALRPPPALVDRTAGLVRELERAVRATELVEHGLDAMLAARGRRELEAQVSLKRGALNLRHSRDAFALIVAGIAAVKPADLAALAAGRGSTPVSNVPSYRVDGLDGDAGGSFDPRM